MRSATSPAAMRARVCADDLGRVQRRPAAERRQPPEHDLFGRLEEVVAPVDQAAQRLLAGLDPAAAAGEEREAVVEASGDVDEREGAQPGRGELDGERQPVEALDQLHGEGLLLRPDREVGPDRGGSRRQQVQGLVAGQRGDRPRDLAGHRERLAARGQHVQPRALGEEGRHQLRGRVDDVLAVVEHDERAPTAEGVHEPVEPVDGGVARPVPVGHAERPRHLGHDGGARRQRCELDERRPGGPGSGRRAGGPARWRSRSCPRHPARPA